MDVAFPLWCKAYGLPVPESEVRFCDRKWRLDHVFPGKVAVEIDGMFGKNGHVGGHRSISGKLRDNEKNNAAILAGYVVLRFSPQEIRSGKAAPVIAEAIRCRMA